MTKDRAFAPKSMTSAADRTVTAEPSVVNFLVESALREVARKRMAKGPQTREQWIAQLTVAMMDPDEAEYAKVLGALVSNGVTRETLLQDYVPLVAQYVGELWVQDRADFVDVSVTSSRLQSLFREDDGASSALWRDRTIPLTQSVLIVVPEFEEHSIGAFVAAEQFRRHGLCVRLAMSMSTEELVETVRNSRFAMIGLTLATRRSVTLAADLIDDLRAKADASIPVAIGGRIAQEYAGAADLAGADLVVRSVREAVEKLGLASTAERLDSDRLR